MSGTDNKYDYGDLEQPKGKTSTYDYGELERSPKTIAPTLLESRRQASKGDLERNQPESTLQSRAREYAIGLLEPLDLHNVPGLVENVGGALWDALSGKGTAKAQQLVKAAVTAPVEPVKEAVSGLASGDFDKAAHGAGGFASVTAPAIYGAASTLERAPVVRPPSEFATELYRTALKRGVKSTADVADVRQLADTGLKHNIPVSEAGAEKLQGLISDVEKEVQAHAQSATQRGVTVNKYKVASRLSPQAAQAAQQALPGSDLATISNAGNEFLASHPSEIPADAALKMKQGTYRSVGDKAYSGEVVNSELTKAQKNLARGFMEELANQVPEIAELTPEQSKMIGMNKAFEKAVNKQANLQGSVFRENVHGVAGG